MKKLSKTILIILSLISLCSCVQKNEFKQTYGNLKEYYDYECLNQSYLDLKEKINDETFIKSHHLDEYLELLDVESISNIDGFLIIDEFEDLTNYSKLSQVYEKNNENIWIIRFDANHQPYSTYYEGLYTDQITPIIIYQFGNDIRNDKRINFFYLLNEKLEWELVDVDITSFKK